MKEVLCSIIAMAGATACSIAPAGSTTPLMVRVQTYGTGINAGPPVGIVADEFETGEARVMRGEAGRNFDAPKNAVTYRLTKASTARILDLVSKLEQAPEPSEWKPCVVSGELQSDFIVVVGDGRHANIDIRTQDGETHYERGEPFYDKVSRIVSLVSGDPEAPPGIVCLPKR